MKRYKRLGSLGKTEKGELVLVNREGQAFLAGDLAIAIWNMCDGKISIEQIVVRISKIASVDEQVARPLIEGVLQQMERVQLMEVIKE